MEIALRAALLAWLQDDSDLTDSLNLIGEEAPLRTPLPWLGLVASASRDWSTKDRKGREVRIALEMHSRGDVPATGLDLLRRVEARIEAMPRIQADFHVVQTQFLRSRIEQRPRNVRAMLVEYHFRLLAADSTPIP